MQRIDTNMMQSPAQPRLSFTARKEHLQALMAEREITDSVEAACALNHEIARLRLEEERDQAHAQK